MSRRRRAGKRSGCSGSEPDASRHVADARGVKAARTRREDTLPIDLAPHRRTCAPAHARWLPTTAHEAPTTRACGYERRRSLKAATQSYTAACAHAAGGGLGLSSGESACALFSSCSNSCARRSDASARAPGRKTAPQSQRRASHAARAPSHAAARREHSRRRRCAAEPRGHRARAAGKAAMR